MKNRYSDFAFDNKAERLSLMYTIHAISNLSKDEIELLKALRQDISLLERYQDDKVGIFPKINRILAKFNLSSIQEVIDIVDNYNLFELYNF